MEIRVRIKSPGKRRDVLAPVSYSIPDDVGTLRELLTAITQQEVDRYNRKEPGVQVVPYLTSQEVDDQARAGKVSFGRLWSDRKANPRKAVDNVLQCWADGLVRVFMDGVELTELDAPLVIAPGSTFTFVRLTFLAGRMW